MWRAITEAMKTTGTTVRFLVIVVVLMVVMAILWRMLGWPPPGLFRAVSRILGGARVSA